MCRGLGLQQHFTTNYIMCEYLKPRTLVNRNPIPELLSQTIDKDQLKQDHLAEGVDFDEDRTHRDYILGRYPEGKPEI
jgi:hypothetical protein